jgi:hypothetical protein
MASGIGIAAFLAATAACGGGNGPTSPGGNNGGGPGPVGATVTITSAGTNSVTISVGQSVTIVNNDTAPHQIQSNPHPAHTDCPAINVVGNIPPGVSRTTNAFTTARGCGFHDHNDETDARWMGTITVQ